MTKNFKPDGRMAGALAGFAKHRAPLKIVVKARDEVEFTRAWIEHHAAIVGLENLLVVDNDSTLAEAFEIYESFGSKLNWFSFQGNHHSINYANRTPELHNAIVESCQYVSFLDMDERLIRFSDEGWTATEDLVTLLSNLKAHIIPAPLLQNTLHQDNQFKFDAGLLLGMVYWGKPVVSTANPHLGTGRQHTVQYPCADADFKGLGVLHLSLLNATQRLRTNKNKLIQLGVATIKNTHQEIAEISIDDRFLSATSATRCINEIRQILQHQSDECGTRASVNTQETESTVTLDSASRLLFSSLETRELFLDFQRRERERSLELLPAKPQYLPKSL